jgi:hypothetical protein
MLVFYPDNGFAETRSSQFVYHGLDFCPRYPGKHYAIKFPMLFISRIETGAFQFFKGVNRIAGGFIGADLQTVGSTRQRIYRGN